MSDLHFLDAHALAAQVRGKKISALELTDLMIARIESIDPELNAVVVRDFERARSTARARDEATAAGRSEGPLHGVPATIKESYNITGLPTTWGLPILKDNIAQDDALAVNRLKAAGAIFLGKTNVPVGLSDIQSYNEIYGQTNNPWDPLRTPGGSSGGSAAALAAGLTALECGSDIAGSIRTPAHYCGVYGHKPTWGIFPPQGHAVPGQVAGSDLAVCGPLARSAEDLALALELVAGPEPLEAPGWRLELPAPPKKKLDEYRVALWMNEDIAPVSSEISARVQEVGEILSRLGAVVSETARPDIELQRSNQNYMKLLNSVMSAALPMDVYEALGQKAQVFDPQDRSDEAIMARSHVLSHREWISANNTRARIRHAWRSFFSDWDILICPQVATVAFPHNHASPIWDRQIDVDGQSRPYTEQFFWSGLVTGAYLPSTSFPTGPNSEGLPIGLQAIGDAYQDRSTIDFARLLAREIGGFQAPPHYR